MLRVAVLGASGFIGNRTVEMLHLGGLAEVRPVVRNVSRLALPSRFSLDCRIADGFDQTALRSALHDCDAVVHAIAGNPATIRGTLAPLYYAAQDVGVRRLIYLSTASVHGQAPEAGTNEASQINDKQALTYNNAKVQAERILCELRDRGRVELVILRPAIVFGPRSTWVAGFVEALLEGQAYLVNDGQGICNSAYVDNVVHAIYLAMTTAGIDREAFLVGDQERLTWSEFYRPFAEALGYDLADIHHVDPIPSAGNATRWVTRISIADGIRSVLSFLPTDAKIALSALRRLIMKPLTRPSPWETAESPRPRASLEMSLLQQCDYKLPTDKARAMLGYEPSVSFAEGSRRTISWLEFAGYPVVHPCNTNRWGDRDLER